MLQEEVLEAPQTLQMDPTIPESSSWERIWNADYLGMGGSFLCLVHCIAPQLLMLGSVGLGLSTFFESETWNLFFWATCFWAVWQAGKQSVFVSMQIALWSAFTVFTLGLGYELLTGAPHLVSYIGSVSLITAHTANLVKQNQWKKWLVAHKVQPKP